MAGEKRKAMCSIARDVLPAPPPFGYRGGYGLTRR